MRKKIFFNGRFLTQPITGVQRTAYEMLKALDKGIEEGIINGNRFEYILIVPKGIVTSIRLNNISIVQKGFLKGNLWEQLELPVYTYGYLLISMGFISSLLKRKQMIIVHDAGTFSNPEFFKLIFRVWYQTAIRILCKTALQIITVSDYSKAQLMRYTGIKEDRIRVIYNAADHVNRFGEADEAFKKKIGELQPFLLGVSSLHPHKNFEALSKAVAEADLAGHKVLIAGGSHSKSFDKVVLNGSVIALGYITNEQLKYLYSKASLFVFPSLFEGFGIPPLEAMAMGCPVLASNATAVPGILGDACEYFDPRNTEELVGKLEALLKDKSRLDELRQKGYRQAANYTWRSSALSLFTLINKFG